MGSACIFQGYVSFYVLKIVFVSDFEPGWRYHVVGRPEAEGQGEPGGRVERFRGQRERELVEQPARGHKQQGRGADQRRVAKVPASTDELDVGGGQHGQGERDFGAGVVGCAQG